MPRALLSTAAAATAALAAWAIHRWLHRRQHSVEAALREDLAAAHLLSHHFGFDELVWNHISARLGDDLLVTSGTEHFDEVTPESLVVSSAANANVTADVIHRAIYMARPDVGAIVHHHTTPTVAVACAAGGLRYLTQDSAAFFGKVAYYDWEGLSDDYDECARIATAFGTTAHTLIMRNHGVLTIGATVGEAWVRHYYLDRIARVQVALGAAPAVDPPKPVLEHAAAQYQHGCGFEHGAKEWCALRRLAERIAAERRLRRKLALLL